MPNQKLIAVILAAGAASRFGSAKFKAIIPGSVSLLQRAVEQAASVKPDKILIISGAWVIHKTATPIDVEILHHPEWEFGMDDSVQFAAKRALERMENGAMLLLPCDMPYLPLSHLGKLKKAVLEEKKLWAATGYENGSPGIPLVWSWNFCYKVTSDPSIKPRQQMALRQSEGQVIFTPGDYTDIDRPEDLKKK